MKEYSIEKKIGYFTLDNARNNDTCMQELGLELNFNHKFRRLRCAGHMINLMAKQVYSERSQTYSISKQLLRVPRMIWMPGYNRDRLGNSTTWIYKSGQRKAHAEPN
jgi:hypothetical protein